MPQYIHPNVREICDNPSSEGSVDLILVPYEGQEETLHDTIQDLFEDQENNQIGREVRFGMLVVTVNEKMVKRICDIPALKSVTLDEGMEVLDAKSGLGDRENDIHDIKEFILIAQGFSVNVSTSWETGESADIGIIDSAAHYDDMEYDIRFGETKSFLDDDRRPNPLHGFWVLEIACFFSSEATFHLYQVAGYNENTDRFDVSIDAFADAVAAAIRRGVDVLNVSLGIQLEDCPGVCPFCTTAQRALDANIPIVAGAGNGYQGERVFCPARRDGVIAVGGYEVRCPEQIDGTGLGYGFDSSSSGPYWMNREEATEYGDDVVEGTFCGQRGCFDDEVCIEKNMESSWSDNVDPYNDKPDVLAPVHHPVKLPEELGDAGGRQELKAGTSFSAPIVTGILGGTLDELRQEGRDISSPQQIRRAVRRSAAPIEESEVGKLNSTRLLNHMLAESD